MLGGFSQLSALVMEEREESLMGRAGPSVARMKKPFATNISHAFKDTSLVGLAATKKKQPTNQQQNNRMAHATTGSKDNGWTQAFIRVFFSAGAIW